MRHLVVIAILCGVATSAVAGPDLTVLNGGGQFDAVTINGVVMPVQDVQQLLAAGVLRLDPVTRRFSIGPGLSQEAQFMAALRDVPLTNPQAPRDLYRSSKVALPNSAAHTVTIPSGFGPAHFGGGPGGVALSGSLGGVSRVPWTSKADGALGLGLSFGNSFDGLGGSVMMSFNDLTDLGNGRRISWGGAVSHYLGDGMSVAAGGENLFVATTDGTASFYVAGSWAFDRKHGQMPFDGVVTLGAGNGRFAEMTPRDQAEGKADHATGVFGSIAWEATPQLNLITEWNGRNLNAGVGYTLPRSGVTVKLGVEDLTSFSGNGPILTGSVGMTLARF